MDTVDRFFIGLFFVLVLATIGTLNILHALQTEGLGHDQATIGGTTVPAVRCAENEAITWLNVQSSGPHKLGCVNLEAGR